ncbi:arylsulfatase [Pseudoroseomonas ludipueritiae]|uniref:Arylsulfatase n=1 Tax=Pseudoroseomonas ludipueritiae TaxID=198093 RepID=A0ABR7R1V1_9PROT|nr:arylsulfatase [Pseudoroseomonas ludipueritiae]MBC9175682.1 arylsulfatase [Pseudoroseomonas ludipueritiae]
MPHQPPKESRLNRRNILLGGAAGASALASIGTPLLAQAQAPSPAPTAPSAAPAAGSGRPPNILVIFGDDIGLWNISHNNGGVTGFSTPNIDRIHREGATFTDYYGEQSCTAGRAAFITGQSPVRTGLTKVGSPGADIGLDANDPTIAQMLKPLGYATGQFGKNHLGDKDEFLPTQHGFDEFFGNLYHLNAEEEPERPNYPQDPAFRRRWGPRGVIRSYADGRVEDTGPLNRKRMETIDDETTAACINFIDRQHQAGRPFFIWHNATRMHIYTHVPESYNGKTGLGFYADGMVQHDDHVGQILKKLDDLGIANDTIVVYSTDNGPHFNEWPDGAITPFRSEKDTNWEGGFRVPCAIRWPGRIPAGKVVTGVVGANDWMPTLLAAAGVPDIKEKLLAGHAVSGRTFKVHLDGYNQLPTLTGDAPSPRDEFFYFDDDGELVAVRKGRWKFVFAEQRSHGFRVWMDPFVHLRIPLIIDLKMDPMERAPTDSNNYYHWLIQNSFLILVAQETSAKWLGTFKDFPPRQAPASFNVDRYLKMLTEAAGRVASH